MMEERTGHLGEVQKKFPFKPAAERSCLAASGLFIMALMGLFYGILEAKGEYDYFLIVPAFILLMGSLQIFRHGLSLKSITIQLLDGGFVVEIGTRRFPFVWDEIDRVDETITKKWGSGYWHLLVTRGDGESFGFFEYDLQDSVELREAIQQGTAAHGVPWEIHLTR